MLPLEELFGLIKCEILPPDVLYFPVLPERCLKSKELYKKDILVSMCLSNIILNIRVTNCSENTLKRSLR